MKILVIRTLIFAIVLTLAMQIALAPGSTRNTTRQAATNHSPTFALSPATQRKSLPTRFTNQYRMEFVLVPAGKFMMGSASGQESEKPVHPVTIAQPFYIGRYEVSQWHWQAVMTTTVAQEKRKLETRSADLGARRMAGEGGDLPIYYVTWEEAHTFLKRLNGLNDGYVYRLPSEAEWEYACRAGSTEDRPADLYAAAWFKTNSTDFVHPAGMRRPNAFGIYDMIGNVSEWCEDSYHPNYDGAPGDGSVWNSSEESPKISRGGSFFTGNLNYLRCSARGAETADHSDFETGFRLVAVPRP